MLRELLRFDGEMEVADIGAAAIAEVPPYKALLDLNLAGLNAFDADERQHASIQAAYGDKVAIFTEIVGDGKAARLYLASPASGMSSLLKPSERHLRFFNGFSAFGRIHQELDVQTTRLDDIETLPQLDYLKMDIQGSELAALKSGGEKLKDCVCVQLEVSFVPLYEGQACFGEIDVWMRAQGYLPHTFPYVKRWSVSPAIRDGNFRVPFNQLLEADIVYFRDLTTPDILSDDQLKKIALIAHHCYSSPDIVLHVLRILADRSSVKPSAIIDYMGTLWSGGVNPVTLYA
jgi:FkbM family methyltransferase